MVNYLKRNYPNANFSCAYEAGFSGFWLQKQLATYGLECIVVNPADVPTTGKENEFKTDPRDCRKIAKSLHSNLLTPIYVPSDRGLAFRSVVRLQNDLVKNQTRQKNKINGLINFYGVKYPPEFITEKSHWSKSFCRWIADLQLNCEENTWVFQYYVQEYLKAKEGVKEVTKKVKEIAKTEALSKPVKLLTSIPGIGVLSAMKILTEIEDIHRFKNLDQLCGYIGLVPTTNSSGEKEKIGEMTNRWNKHLKTTIIESAWSSIHHDPSMSQKYFKLIKRMDSNKAIVRIAKSLVARILHVLIKEVEHKKIG